MYTQQEQDEAIRAAFRAYDLRELLTLEMHSLVKALHLVDTKASRVLCMGKCLNGGKCTKTINQADLVRGLMGLPLLVSTKYNDFEKQLPQVCERFLCLNYHRTGTQIAQVTESARKTIEIVRRQHSQTSIPAPTFTNASSSFAMQVSPSTKGTTGASMVMEVKPECHKQIKQASKGHSKDIAELDDSLEAFKSRRASLTVEFTTRGNYRTSFFEDQVKAPKTNVNKAFAKPVKIIPDANSKKSEAKPEHQAPYPSIMKRDIDNSYGSAFLNQVNSPAGSNSKAKERQSPHPNLFSVQKLDKVKSSKSTLEDDKERGPEGEGALSDDEGCTLTPTASEISTEDFAEYQGWLESIDYDGVEKTDEESDGIGRSSRPQTRITYSCTVM